MIKNYCIQCAKNLGIYNPANLDNLFDPPYQLGKVIKHTVPKSCSGPLSIFSDPSTKAYENYIVSSINSCCVQVDTSRPMSRQVSLFWLASEKTGVQYNNGFFKCDHDGVRVVNHDDKFKIHGYPASSRFNSNRCLSCGIPIPG